MILICDKLCSSGVFGTELIWVSLVVIEGESVTLNTGLTSWINEVGRVWWYFENNMIADTNVMPDNITVYDDVLDGRFRDRLKLDKKTASLTITNITTEHAGDYKVISKRYMAATFSVIVYGELHLFHLLTF